MSLANQSRVSPQLARISKRPDIVEKPSPAIFNTDKRRTLHSIPSTSTTRTYLLTLFDHHTTIHTLKVSQAAPQVARPAAPMKAAHLPRPFWTSIHSTENQNASTDAALRRRTQ